MLKNKLSKQEIVQIYMHFRKYLSPEEMGVFIHDYFGRIDFDIEQLEQIRSSKKVNAKRKGTLRLHHHTY